MYILLQIMRLAFLAALAAPLAIVGCSGDTAAPDAGEPTNRPPKIEFTVAARAVARSAPSSARFENLTVDVSDPDGDAVTVHWEVTRGGQPSGVLNELQQGDPLIRWQVPTEPGRDTITITAWDGKEGGTTTLVETIQVGTVKEGGTQAGSQTWLAEDSPFIIQSSTVNFVIGPGSKLSVEAGCELLIDKKGLQLNVEGTLETHGTAVAPVVVRPNTRTTQPGDWQGVIASPNDPAAPVVRLNYTQLMYATKAVRALTPSEVDLYGCGISLAKESAVDHESWGALSVRNSVITRNGRSGIRITRLSVPEPANVVISGNRIRDNGDLSGETPYVKDAAIYIAIPDKDSTWTITISGNEISGNGFPGIQLVHACYPRINGNAIFWNEYGKAAEPYNIKLDKDFGAEGTRQTIDATDNFWGGPYPEATGEIDIKQMIRDSEDDASIAVRVLVKPWLNESP